MSKYQIVIGLEIHCELLTKTKMYCKCKNSFGGDKNSRICPVCMGFPGALPTVNHEAVILAAKAGFATNCKVHNRSSFDRKNYFYPDLPKGYQITQFYNPICTDGHITLSSGKKINISRIHIEEDAGKLIHKSNNSSEIDYNRCGVPLIEIVTAPDFRSTDEVCEFVEKTALTMKYADICDSKMEQGSLRVDVNISVMPESQTTPGTRTEIKNLNSLRSICAAISYEADRQIALIESGENVTQETRRFNEKNGKTYSMRSKENSNDYKYFPEPDLEPVFISPPELEKIRESIPVLPSERFSKYLKYGLSEYETNLLTQNRAFSDFYDAATEEYKNYKGICNIMLGEMNRYINETKCNVSDFKFTPQDLAALVKMNDEKVISTNSAKEIFKIMFFEGTSPKKIAEENGFILTADTALITEIIDDILSQNSTAVFEYKSGNTKVFSFLMGEAMKKLGKSANPKLVKEIFNYKLS